jgi:phage terminase small subunit
MTHQERTFADRFAATGDKQYSATAAGYGSARQRASEVLARPAVQAEIQKRQVERLWNDALPAAVDCLISIMTDAKAPAGARVQASKVTLDRTLGMNEGKDGKEPHEMTPEELAAALADAKLKAAHLETVKADRARPIVDVEPIDDSEDEGILG